MRTNSKYRVAGNSAKLINDELTRVSRDVRGKTWASADRPTDGSLLQAVVSDDDGGSVLTFFDETTSTWKRASKTETFTVATLPTDGSHTTAIVSDEVGGTTHAFWDGAAWRRTRDLVVVS
jgi:hypothetical protein